jgi:hypothetical protein
MKEKKFAVVKRQDCGTLGCVIERYLEQVLITTQCSYQYSDENFDLNREDRLNVLYHHIYSKEYKKRVKVRKEVQEYPNKSLKEAFMDKIKEDDNDNGDKTFTIGL